MNQNIWGLIISFAFVFIVISISMVINLNKKIDVEISRKFVHIGVSNWWLIAMYYFDSPIWASIPPVFFIVFNIISNKFNLIKSMERERHINGYGTIFYPISLTILSMFCFSSLSYPYIGAISVLCMGYGDGVAAIIGKKFGRHNLVFLSANKSLEGCIAMFAISFLSAAIILQLYGTSAIIINAILIACVSTCLEMFTPNGYDNLTVPIGVAVFAQIILLR